MAVFLKLSFNNVLYIILINSINVAYSTKCPYCDKTFANVKKHTWRCTSNTASLNNNAARSNAKSNVSISPSIYRKNSVDTASINLENNLIFCCCGKGCKCRTDLIMHQRSCKMHKTIQLSDNPTDNVNSTTPAPDQQTFLSESREVPTSPASPTPDKIESTLPGIKLSNLNNSHSNSSIKQLKKRTEKQFKLLGQNNQRFDNIISKASKAIRSRIASKKHQKMHSKRMTSKLSSKNDFGLHPPNWVPKLQQPSSPCNTSPPSYHEISTIIRKYKSKSSLCPFDQISLISFKKCSIHNLPQTAGFFKYFNLTLIDLTWSDQFNNSLMYSAISSSLINNFNSSDSNNNISVKCGNNNIFTGIDNNNIKNNNHIYYSIDSSNSDKKKSNKSVENNNVNYNSINNINVNYNICNNINVTQLLKLNNQIACYCGKFCKGWKSLKMHPRSCKVHKTLQLSNVTNARATTNVGISNKYRTNREASPRSQIFKKPCAVANAYFQLNCKSLPAYENLNKFNLAFQLIIYNYFASNFGTVNSRTCSNVNSNKDRKFEKEIKQLENSRSQQSSICCSN
ncbi:hypothetical protein HELRODRAFT_179088 [Helobdella robusta]|uniref:C2H2-type domain-containing protein n=1 Tax=Helobdella robusta TaxID=6412 RepID=T1FE56_HELRO|nr:hypothetical protein HELRODRAFT_179088 [Helobdella robusta]ESN95627.1 hypothetical protein HELRODRAFT_179088 [Helobdella robusta]